jgi:3-phosphoshikimate 1-carboxyvinyltransferase
MPDARDEALGLAATAPVRGRLTVPGSKSLAQRALVCAGLCGGTTRIVGLSTGDDVRAALELVEACGARVERASAMPAAVAIAGVPPGPHRGWQPRDALDVGESGTLARLATAALALCGHAGRAYEIRARGSLQKRSSRALFAALARAGVVLESVDAAALEPAERWPVRVQPIGPPSELEIVAPRSSQEVSALLVALAAYPDEIALRVRGEIPSRPYLEMTLHVLREFGVAMARSRASDGESFDVRGPLRAPATPFAIEPDASSAAVALALACLSNGAIEVPGLDRRSCQGDVRILDHLAHFGCHTRADGAGLHAAGSPSRGAEIDLAGEPDLAPVLAAIGACVARRVQIGAIEGAGVTRLTGLDTLPGKESSRIAVLGEGLQAIGLEVDVTDRALAIAPGARSAADERGAIVLDPRGDHRMAFAFALLGLVRPGVFVRDAQCVAKSWPRFWRDLEPLGVRVERMARA